MRKISTLFVFLALAVCASPVSAGDMLGDIVLMRGDHVLTPRERMRVIAQIEEIEKTCAKFLSATNDSQAVKSAKKRQYGPCVTERLKKYPELYDIKMKF